ncbi:MAG: glycoside hydrolase family 38 [Gemmatimonadetes bacterium]|nr:glycoside hydrolase family 38 [Gemmatimonadota bacterium]
MTARLDEILVVTHTHWDREWYHAAERFRQRLVRLVDELLDDPPTSGESFLLDGQAVLIEDYLGVRPERAAELSSLLRDGRLEAGPWYVLADELIPSGEALVRNLSLGRETLARLRADAPPVLYCPDSFGHPAILPELAAGFGCELIVLWRGFGGARSPAWDVVRWRGPSGTTVLVYHLPPDGYEFGSSLPVKQSEAAGRWRNIAETLAPRAMTGTALLLNGADHHARQRDLGAAIAAGGPRVKTVSLRSAARSIVSAAAASTLEEISGELRDSYGYAWTLQGTLATRAARKRRNAQAERALVNDLEPWLALSNDRASRALLDGAWRTLLQAHPHDTLCGTSVDAVADAFDMRLASVEAQVDELRRYTVQALLNHDVDRARTTPAEWKPAVVVRNASARPRGGVVELALTHTAADVAVGPGSGNRQGERRPVPEWRVNDMAIQVLSTSEQVALTESPRAYPDADIVTAARAVGWIRPLGAFTVSSHLHGGTHVGAIPNPVNAAGLTVDNGLVRVSVSESGNVLFEDIERARRIEHAVTLERARDVGDLYTPAIRESFTPPIVRRVHLVHRGPLRAEIALDFDVSSEGGSCCVAVQLDADSRAVKVVVTGDNRERDHRLRVRFATGLGEAATLADAAFLPVERSPLSVRAEDQAMEHVVPAAPLHRWVARFADDGGAVLISDGLAEYESLAGGSIAVTLVRAVGELSRADLPERPGHAGWPSPTPQAQSIGSYEARFALQLTGPDSHGVRDEINRLAEDVLVPLVGETLRSNLRDASLAGGLELRGPGLRFSAAAPARRDGWRLLRCVNIRDHDVHGSWHLARPVVEAQKTRLDECTISPLEVVDNVIHFSAGPHEIVTVLLRY